MRKVQSTACEELFGEGQAACKDLTEDGTVGAKPAVPVSAGGVMRTPLAGACDGDIGAGLPQEIWQQDELWGCA